MNRFLAVILACAFCLHVAAQDNLSALMPMPNQCEVTTGKCLKVTSETHIVSTDNSLNFAADELHNVMMTRMGCELAVVNGDNARKGDLKLLLDNTLKCSQTYRLEVRRDGVTIAGATPGAVLYGIMTFSQLLLGDVCSTRTNQIAPVKILDSPRFERRALMLDPARHFLTVKEVKFYIDQMIRYKYNVLQLHLTDDQGWRMEINGHPELNGDGKYYTQADLRELIDYAAQRNVEIVPELDIPGHTVALLAVHPEMECTVNDTIPKVVGKTFDLMVCANQQAVYDFYGEVIAQVASVFPSQYIHLGGDEAVVEKNWSKCERCRRLMAEKGYTNAKQLMIPFFEKMLGFVKKEGKHAILWCELNNIYPPADDYLFPYPKDVVLVPWRGGLTPTCLELANKSGHKLLMAPGEYVYFDYPQLKGDLPEYNNWGMPVTTLHKTYEFDPGYGKSAAEQSPIVGVMGTLWGEAINDVNRATYMTYPRGLALAEAGWTQMKHRSWDSFKQRLYPNLLDLMKSGVSVRVPFEIVNE